MNFIQRAFKNVTRKLSKTILLIITFFVIGNFVIVGLGVANAADNAKVLTRQKMRAVVTYGVDYDAVWKYTESITDEDELNEFYENYPSVKLSDVKEILADSRVSTANAFSTSMAYMTDEYDFVHLNNSAEENMGNNGQECWFDEDGNQKCDTYIEPTHFIKSNMFPNMIEFVDGGYEVVDGRFYTQEEIDDGELVLLVSKAFAELNGIRVGDTYSFYITSPNERRYYDGLEFSEDILIKDFEVIGIFEHQDKIMPDASNYDYTYPYENPDNMLLMPATSMYMAQLEYQHMIFQICNSRSGN